MATGTILERARRGNPDLVRRFVALPEPPAAITRELGALELWIAA